MPKKQSTKEEFKVNSEQLVKKIKQLVKEGNVRRIIIKDEQDKTLMEIPLTFAVVGTVLLPVFAAVGALAALLTKCSIVVERRG
jgi:hypothetical protein